MGSWALISSAFWRPSATSWSSDTEHAQRRKRSAVKAEQRIIFWLEWYIHKGQDMFQPYLGEFVASIERLFADSCRAGKKDSRLRAAPSQCSQVCALCGHGVVRGRAERIVDRLPRSRPAGQAFPFQILAAGTFRPPLHCARSTLTLLPLAPAGWTTCARHAGRRKLDDR